MSARGLHHVDLSRFTRCRAARPLGRSTAGIARRTRVKSWPVTLSVPWGLTPFPPPVYLPLPTRIRMEILDPIRFDRSGEDAASDDNYVSECAARVEGLMQATLDRLAGESRS